MYYGSMESGGQGVWLANVTRELARLGHDVHVISGPPYPTLDPAVREHRIRTHSFQAMMLDRRAFFHDVPPLTHFHPLDFYEFATSRFTFASLIAVFSVRALAKIAELEATYGRFDVIHDNQTLSYGVWMARAVLGRPVVATVHHPLDLDVRNGLRQLTSVRARALRIAWYPWKMQPFVARRLDAVVFPSRASAEMTARLWSLPRERLRTVYNGVDTDVFRPGEEERCPGALLFVGNAEDYNKGVVYALRAMALLPASTNAHLYLVGGPAGAQRVAPAEVARLGIEDRVTIVGRVSEAELAAWYRRAEALVSPSLYEGFGLPAAEAMACATPVIATGAGALPEVVADGETGVIVPPADAGALAGAAAALLADPARRRRMGAAGRERVLQRFTWGRSARELEELYRELRG
ncbi:MAG TPA: glycosyltransferase family 4 protein [Dehalococcoidia bacterium]|nr:glycosyltransferase family 4 protein [Dehalococcoidia bacterium]